ncbi:ferritin-like domain-containing protein [Bacillus tuaregi]|uniref:ferritin-like domain-containing protein n=1 Tax=Bacillus tuaregi TaxID=1816695 RepID=UPI0008F969BD|nr:ferritin-like domain-containing protein [Bacillus tuaregi]
MYPSYSLHYCYQRQTKQLIKDIEQAINDEYNAIHYYEKISKLARFEKERKQILKILSDEKKHYRQFIQIYSSLTGRQPRPKLNGNGPNSYRKGIELAIRNEQSIVSFYLEIADKSSYPYVKDVFRRAAADEQNHAVWFLYFLVNLNWLRT